MCRLSKNRIDHETSRSLSTRSSRSRDDPLASTSTGVPVGKANLHPISPVRKGDDDDIIIQDPTALGAEAPCCLAFFLKERRVCTFAMVKRENEMSRRRGELLHCFHQLSTSGANTTTFGGETRLASCFGWRQISDKRSFHRVSTSDDDSDRIYPEYTDLTSTKLTSLSIR